MSEKEYKTIDIHGKEYVTVPERVKHFHEEYPNGSIVSKHEKHGNVFIVTTTVIPDIKNPERKFTGLAYEIEGSTNVNKGSALENCETSAVGRAMGFLNIGVIDSIASADEMVSVTEPVNNSNNQSTKSISNPDGQASEKQLAFVDKLVSEIEKLNPSADLTFVDKSNKGTASASIEKLLEIQKQEQNSSKKNMLKEKLELSESSVDDVDLPF